MLRKALNKCYSLAELAQALDATFHGDPDTQITGICALDEAKDKHLAFAQINRTEKITELVNNASFSALMLSEEVVIPDGVNFNFLLVKDIMPGLIKLMELFYTPVEHEQSHSPLADIHPSAQIGEGVSIGAFCSIGANCTIGNNCTIYPHVTIYPDVEIGNEVVLHSNCVIREGSVIGARNIIQNGAIIGADGFGYIPDAEEGIKAVPQLGTVVTDNAVEIGANACVDRATIGTTRLARGVKIDNLVQVGHNTKIGDFSILCGQVGVSGSCNIGKGVTLGGDVGVADHISITDGCRVAAKGGVTRNLTERGDYAGFPATPVSEWRRSIARLSSLDKQIRSIKKSIKNTNKE